MNTPPQMKRFLLQILLFCFIIGIVLTVSLLFIPNKQIANNSLFASIDKHNRLDSLLSPKIIFVGGSNAAYGIDSKSIEDSLKIPVVNMGLHAGFGLMFMLNEVESSINEGDVIVVLPEYHHFTSKNIFYGEKVLVALLTDVDRKNIKYITIKQAFHLFPLAVKYSVSKILRIQMDIMDSGDGKNYESVYNRNSFNKYGDEVMHWEYPNQPIGVLKSVRTKSDDLFNESFEFLGQFRNKVSKKGVSFYLLPPSLMSTSFENDLLTINQIEKKMNNIGLPFQILPIDFAYADSLYFNTAYHLNKQGVNLRTQRIISFLKEKNKNVDK